MMMLVSIKNRILLKDWVLLFALIKVCGQQQLLQVHLIIPPNFKIDNSMKLKLLELIHNWFMSDSTNVIYAISLT